MSNFAPGQIIYLEHYGERLYGEVIQLIPSRQMVWLRPILLQVVAPGTEPPLILSEAADLVWPIQPFQPALDVEVLPLLSAQNSKPANSAAEDGRHRQDTASQQFRRFIDRVWAHRSNWELP